MSVPTLIDQYRQHMARARGAWAVACAPACFSVAAYRDKARRHYEAARELATRYLQENPPR